MIGLSMIPIGWKVSAALALVAMLGAAHVASVHSAFDRGHAAAVSERASADALAVTARLKENAAVAVKQATTNTTITKVKNEELAPVLHRIVAERVRIGPAIRGSATPAKTDGASSSDSADPPGRLVREDVERDIRALKAAVEQDLATGRACQAFVRENGLQP